MTRRARDVLLDILRDEGITHIFGNPGSTEMPLMDALVDAPDISYVLGLQEATAVAMADGWALATGRAGFVNLHAMGGLGNAMGVLVASKASETPLVVTAGQQDTRHLMTEPWLSGDLVALAGPVTKWAKELRRGEDVGQALRRAFAICRTPPCGPVFLSLPMDILDQEVNRPTPPRLRRAAPRAVARRGAAGREARGPRSGSRHGGARRRPLGVREPGSDRLRRGRRLCGLGHAAHLAHGVSVPSSLLGRGAQAGFRRHARTFRERAGDRAGRRPRLRGLPYREAEPVPEGVAVMHIADNPDAFGREHAAEIALLGDIGATLRGGRQSGSASSSTRTRSEPGSPRAGARGRRQGTTRRGQFSRKVRASRSPDAAVLAALDALPEDAIIANNSAATFGRVQDLMTTEPGRYFFSRGGVLGCSMPAAVGASLATGGWVVAFVGDGGAMYSPQALWSAAHIGRK